MNYSNAKIEQYQARPRIVEMNIPDGQSIPNERTPIINHGGSSNYGDSPNNSVSSYDDWEYPGSGSVVKVDHLQFAEEMPEYVN